MFVAETLIQLTKHHGLGNDFLIALNPDREIGSPEAKRWCERRTGVGADGLIVAHDSAVEPGGRHWTMVLWNADGSRAEISGNGIRCLGQAIGMAGADKSPVTDGAELVIYTDAGARILRLHPSGGDTWQVRAGMGQATEGPAPSTAWADTGLEPSHQLGVDIGNPHIVAIVDKQQFDDARMGHVGPLIEAGYASGINVHVVAIEADNAIQLKVWERGVGITHACGSGACAAAWVANRLGFVGPEITVSMPGGSASVELTDDEVFLIGPATFVGSIRIA